MSSLLNNNLSFLLNTDNKLRGEPLSVPLKSGNVLENLIIMFLLEDFFSVDDIPEEEWEQLSQSEYDSDYLPSQNDSMQDSEEV